MAVEDAGVAEDVHEEGVGAVGGVEFHPAPVFACDRAARGGVGFREAAEPLWICADVGVGGGMEVSVSALFVAAEDDYGIGAGGFVVEEVLGSC